MITESAEGDEVVSVTPGAVPSVGDVDGGALQMRRGGRFQVEPRQQQVDEIVRCDGAQVPLEPAQHQQLPLLIPSATKKKLFIFCIDQKKMKAFDFVRVERTFFPF